MIPRSWMKAVCTLGNIHPCKDKAMQDYKNGLFFLQHMTVHENGLSKDLSLPGECDKISTKRHTVISQSIRTKIYAQVNNHFQSCLVWHLLLWTIPKFGALAYKDFQDKHWETFCSWQKDFFE